MYYQFDSLEISNLDNSAWGTQPTELNVMAAAAVAFEINLVDSSFNYFEPAVAQHWRPNLNTAQAMERCRCPFHFFPDPEIDRLSILTLRDFSPDQPAGSDITALFLWQNDWNHLYRSIDSLVPMLNEPFYDEWLPAKKFQVFCQDSVENDSLQLVFRVEFVNGEVLADTTNVVAIRRSGEEVLP